jgi:hypothetical protein
MLNETNEERPLGQQASFSPERRIFLAPQATQEGEEPSRCNEVGFLKYFIKAYKYFWGFVSLIFRIIYYLVCLELLFPVCRPPLLKRPITARNHVKPISLALNILFINYLLTIKYVWFTKGNEQIYSIICQ